MNDGSIISEENLKGCISLIVFFHTSCKDCRQVLPVLQRFHEAYSQYPIACISRAENEVAVAAYWKEQGFTLPYSAQEDRTVYELFAQTGVPRIYIVDEEGIIRCLFTDQMLPEWEELVKALDKLTQQKKIVAIIKSLNTGVRRKTYHLSANARTRFYNSL